MRKQNRFEEHLLTVNVINQKEAENQQIRSGIIRNNFRLLLSVGLTLTLIQQSCDNLITAAWNKTWGEVWLVSIRTHEDHRVHLLPRQGAFYHGRGRKGPLSVDRTFTGRKIPSEQVQGWKSEYDVTVEKTTIRTLPGWLTHLHALSPTCGQALACNSMYR